MEDDAMPQHDLMIVGATVVDPARGDHAAMDIAFRDGRVSDANANLNRADADEVIDATGRYVIPGMIDVHVHVFEGVSHYGIPPDPTCLAKGATTVVDAGSAGADTFPGFRKYVIDVSETRVLAQVNISSQGMLTQEIGEFTIPEYANVAKACAMIEQHRDVILGVKVRLTRNSLVSEASGMSPLHRAREAADAAGLPIMVHPQDAWCDSLDDILAVMGEGDILTHCFHGHPCGILDDRGRVRPSVHDAIERGVLLDVGHGQGSFSWRVVESALEQGVEPHTISSDLHVYNVDGPVYDLANVVTKFLHLGMSLRDAIAKVTSIPAGIVGMAGEIGTLTVGAWGDAVVCELREGEYVLEDSHGETRAGATKLVPVTVIKSGRVYQHA
jgi:dihydroorotase